jgi:hypothetical protein
MFHAIEENLARHRTKTFATLREIEETVFSLNVLSGMTDAQDIPAAEIKRHLGNIHKHTIDKFLSFENVKDFAV